MAPRQQGLLGFLKGSSTANKKHASQFYSNKVNSKRQRRETSSQNTSRFGACPLCNANLPLHVLEAHAEACTTGNNNNNNNKAEETLSVEKNGSEIAPASPPSENVSRFESCPICNASFPLHLLIAHAESCTGASTTLNVKKKAPTVLITKPPPKPNDEPNEDITNHTAKETKQESPSTPSTPWWKLAPHQQQKNRPRIDNPILPSSEPIPGLYLFENFITEQEETLILAQLDGTSSEHGHEFLPWNKSTFNGSHKGKRWGVHCNLRDRRVDAPEHPMPHFYTSILLPKLQRIEQMSSVVPNEANAIDYRRLQGHWLQRHVDDRQLSKEPIANLSIAGDCFMTFTNTRTVNEKHRILLKRQTLQILTGKARYEYAHGIDNQDLLSDRRVSITMRESPLTTK